MPTMFDILQAQIEKDKPNADRVGFWFINERSRRISSEPLIYTVRPSQMLAAWIVTGIYPLGGGRMDKPHHVPEIGNSREMEMVFDVAKALIQACEIQMLAEESEAFRQRADDLRQLKSIADPNTAATLGSVYMGIARDRADMGLPTNMQLSYSPEGILTVNGKWQSKRPEEAITSWGLENAQEIKRLERTTARRRVKKKP